MFCDWKKSACKIETCEPSSDWIISYVKRLTQSEKLIYPVAFGSTYSNNR